MESTSEKIWKWTNDHAETIVWACVGLGCIGYLYAIYRSGYNNGVVAGQAKLAEQIAKTHPEEFKAMLSKEIGQAVDALVK